MHITPMLVIGRQHHNLEVFLEIRQSSHITPTITTDAPQSSSSWEVRTLEHDRWKQSVRILILRSLVARPGSATMLVCQLFVLFVLLLIFTVMPMFWFVLLLLAAALLSRWVMVFNDL